MIKDAKIVIASVLKPVDDVRNCYKIGKSLSKISNYNISLLGTSGHPVYEENLKTHSWKPFKHLSLARLNVQFEFSSYLKRSKPDLVIVTTHELLFSAVLCKLLLGYKLIYDVQEDYFKNLWHQRFYPQVFRHLLAISIRCFELICTPFINGYFLAESIYQKDISFTKTKAVILDNKSLPIETNKTNEPFNVVFTGTLSHYSKVIESIELFLKIRNSLPKSQMTVIGYCPKKTYLEKLKMDYGDQIILKLSHHPVPHSEIEQKIAEASLAIIGYEPNPINQFKIPTKLYEYVAARVPYIVRSGSYWEDVGLKLGGVISQDFENSEVDQILSKLEQMNNSSFVKRGFLWEENEQVLFDCVKRILD